MQTKSNKKIIAGLASIVIVIVISVFVVAVARGWFNGKIKLSDKYYNETSQKVINNEDEYNTLVKDRESFILITYLPSCTAKILNFMKDFAAEHNISYYYYNFANLKETSIHDIVRFTPSVAVFSEGHIISYLKADSNDDIEKYNDYNAFKVWLESLIEL